LAAHYEKGMSGSLSIVLWLGLGLIGIASMHGDCPKLLISVTSGGALDGRTHAEHGMTGKIVIRSALPYLDQGHILTCRGDAPVCPVSGKMSAAATESRTVL